MSASLEKLVESLKGDLPHLTAAYPEHAELLARKGGYPYEYMDSFIRFDKTELPSMDDFGSSLNGSVPIDPANYYHAIKVKKDLGCKTLGEYHDLYLKTDVLLLTDVFEKYRRVALENYQLDPCYYITAPSLAWIHHLRIQVLHESQQPMFKRL